MSVSAPKIGVTFAANHEFYSRQEGELDFTQAKEEVLADCDKLFETLDQMDGLPPEEDKVDRIRKKLTSAEGLANTSEDPEDCKRAMGEVEEAKVLMGKLRKQYAKVFREAKLNSVCKIFDDMARKHAQQGEITTFERQTQAARRSMDKPSHEFEDILDDMWGVTIRILYNQDWFIIDRFKYLASNERLFTDRNEFQRLTQEGRQALQRDDMDALRQAIFGLHRIMRDDAPADAVPGQINIM